MSTVVQRLGKSSFCLDRTASVSELLFRIILTAVPPYDHQIYHVISIYHMRQALLRLCSIHEQTRTESSWIDHRVSRGPGDCFCRARLWLVSEPPVSRVPIPKSCVSCPTDVVWCRRRQGTITKSRGRQSSRCASGRRGDVSVSHRDFTIMKSDMLDDMPITGQFILAGAAGKQVAALQL